MVENPLFQDGNQPFGVAVREPQVFLHEGRSIAPFPEGLVDLLNEVVHGSSSREGGSS
jgi:hypothetical protein